MRNFLQNLAFKTQSFMQGRYGVDELSNITVIISLVLLALSYAFSFPLLYILSIILAVWAFSRCLSRNITKRYKEKQWYITQKQKLIKKIKFRKELREMKKTHRLYKCRNCKTILRVPKGVGKIKITCSKCKATMIKRA